MVEFQVRWMKKRYKKKEYRYKRYSMDFPTKLNEKIEPHMTKDFDNVDLTSHETDKQEIVNITLIRNKLTEETGKQRPE